MAKILYGINGTGHGHLSRAKQLIPKLKKTHDVDILISGVMFDLDHKLNIKYRFRGITIYFDKKGNVSYLKIMLKNNWFTFLKNIFTLNLSEYDLIISDFEPITAWSSKFQKVPSIQLSNQAIFQYKETPRLKKCNMIAHFVLKWFSPCKKNIALSFEKHHKDMLYPFIRDGVKTHKTSTENYTLVYLYHLSIDIITDIFCRIEGYHFKIFTPKVNKKITINNCTFYPTSKKLFLESLINCSAVITAAGFELTSEALFLQKKLLVAPQGNQYEQAHNALFLKNIGVKTIEKLSSDKILEWLKNKTGIKNISFSSTSDIIRRIEDLI